MSIEDNNAITDNSVVESPNNSGDSFVDDSVDLIDNQPSGQKGFYDIDTQNPSKWDMAKAAAFRKTRQKLMRAPMEKLGEQVLGDKSGFLDGRETPREKAKEIARQKARDFAKNKLANKIGNEGIKKGLEKGLSKGASKLAKDGAKKLGKEAGKKVAEEGVKMAAKGTAQAATKGLQSIISGAAVASGPETFGLGFILGMLLNIAISLGINDAVDSAFEIAAGNFKQAKFLAVRAATKVGMFVVLLCTLVTIFTPPFGWIIGPILLILLNIYMIMGFIFKNVASLQGLVWWEIGLIVIVDFMFIIFFLTFTAAVLYWVCDQSGLGGGIAANAVAKVVDWWSGTTYTTVVNDMCTSIRPYLPN